MPATKILKVIFQDNGQDKAITGYLIKENDNFIQVRSTEGYLWDIAKAHVIAIKRGVG